MNGDNQNRRYPRGTLSSTKSFRSTAAPNEVDSITIGSKPSVIDEGSMRFLVMDAPRQSNLHLYINECIKQGVTDLARVCEPTYSGEIDLANAGINLHELAYPDGTSPPKEVLEQWLDLVHQRFFSKNKASETSALDITTSHVYLSESRNNTSITPLADRTIAVHCVAGLGRAPVLVAIALVEFAGMDPVDAVTFIRRHRRGAINEKQLNYLEKYKKNWKGTTDSDAQCSCVIQ